MRIFNTSSLLEWGELDVPLLGLENDWFGDPLAQPLAYSLVADPGYLWFVATRGASYSVHPDAAPGKFTPRLWEFDVAELFIADSLGEAYLEFNLAPNGAWWAAGFSSARVLAAGQPDFPGNVETYNDVSEPGVWIAAMRIPLAFLEKHVSFGLGSKANVAFILNSPNQTFHSVSKLPGAEPDFHQPSKFPRMVPVKLPVA